MKEFVKRVACPLAVFLVLACVSCGGGSSSQPTSSSSASSGTTFVCYTSPTAQKITVSAVFHVGPVDSVTALEEPWAKGFRTYIAQSGNEGGISVTCDQLDPKGADTAVKSKIDGWTKEGHQVVQTNYKYAN
jgi:ABC-type phosphate transport system substrate-binding protein